MKVGDTFSGFQLKKEQYIDEVKSVTRLFEHKKSGARLLHLENDDDNKVFSIAFKTPSYDDTGVPHILEHSVLCGSKNFPTKEPFLELIRSSLHTFLNAMTYPDKTIYPVASRNNKDFFNLMNVYLDAVFYPNIYEKPEIFMQEGWHYHLENEKDRLLLNGIVYSEMKGYYSSPEGLLDEESLKSLYSDTNYKFSYGGKPEEIPNLSYEKFLEFHKKHYHPSNSYIYIYGDGDIKEQLKFLDEKYLSNFQRKDDDVSLLNQEPYEEMRRLDLNYSVAQEDSVENKTYFSLNYSCGSELKRTERFALEILVYYLMKTKSAPLKKILLKENIGHDTFGHFEEDILSPYVSIVVKNSEKEKRVKFLKIVNKTLKQFIEEGLDKELLKACFNIFEFNLREADFGKYPKGIFYNLTCLKNWVYGEDPFEFLSYEDTFKQLRSLLEEDYFEKLLEKYFLKNTHTSLVVLEPERGLLEKKEKKLQLKLDEYKKNLSKDDLDSLIEKTLKFKKYQKTPDSLEDIEKIPTLKIADVSKDIERIPTEIKEKSGLVVLHNPLDTNGICYLNLAFDTKIVPLEKLYSLNILSLLLGRVATKRYSYSELDIFVQEHTGGCSFGRNTFLLRFDDSKYIPKLIVSGKVLSPKFSSLMEILFEIMGESKFEDKGHIKEIIQGAKSGMEMGIESRGNFFVNTRLLSYFSEYGKYNEYTNGVSYYHYLIDLLKDFDSKWPSLKNDLEYLLGVVFNKSNLVANIACEAKDYEGLEEVLLLYTPELNSSGLPEHSYNFPKRKINEGLLTQNSVLNIAKGNNFKSLGYEYSGKLLVLKNIIKGEYLWNEVRVQGGAYGSSCGFARHGVASFSSFRDPNLIQTFERFENSVNFLRNFETENFDKFVVGAIGDMDIPLTFSMKAEKAFSMYLSDISEGYLQKERDEVLSTTIEDIKGFDSLVSDLFKEKYYCVLGNEGEIKKNKTLFGALVSVHE